MGENDNPGNVKADPLAAVQEADRKGKVNVVKAIMDDPEVQGIIKSSLLKETVKNSIFMAMFLVGILKLYEVAKSTLNLPWQVDLGMSLTLIALGLIYILKSMIKGNGHGTPSLRNPRSS